MTQEHILQFLRLIRHHDATIPKIRIGVLGDGGYVINNDLAGLDGVISLGIAGECSFDEYFAGQGIKVYQYDPSVDAPPVEHPNFVFRKLAWAAENGPETRSLQGIIDENGLSESNELIFKFDVEGAEWPSFDSVTTDQLKKFRIITGEFHGFFHLSNPAVFQKFASVFSLLHQTHLVTHIHPNNCSPVTLVDGVPLPNLLEISFLRRDRARFVPSTQPIPSIYDYPNVPTLPEIALTAFCGL